MKFDLRKTRASTVVDEIDQDDIFLYDEKKANPLDFISNIELNPKKIIGFLIRVALCGVGTLILIQYEKSNIKKLSLEKTMANTELSKLKSQKEQVKKEVDGFGYMKKKSEEFQNKLEILKSLANTRLSALSSLDHIQNVIPEEVWLKRVQLDNNRFTIEGLSVNREAVQKLADEMENINLFTKVMVTKTDDIEDSQSGTKIHFNIKSMLQYKEQ